MKRLGILIVGLVLALLVGAAPASARQVVVEDPAGDAPEHTIDFSRVTVDNNNDHISARIRLYNADRGGTLILSANPREARGVRLVSEYDPVGHTSNYVLDGAFGDGHPSHQPKRCRGFHVNWQARHPVVIIEMPSRCMNGGDYGAVQFTVLTEGDSGSDADDMETTRWVPRG